MCLARFVGGKSKEPASSESVRIDVEADEEDRKNVGDLRSVLMSGLEIVRGEKVRVWESSIE